MRATADSLGVSYVKRRSEVSFALFFAGASLLALVAYAAVPVTGAHAVIQVGLEFAAAAVLLFVSRRRRDGLPWLLLGLALLSTAIGAAIYYGAVLWSASPTPGPLNDVFWLGFLAATGAALVVLLQRRVGTAAALLDAAVISAALGLVATVVIVEPYIAHEDLSTLGKVTQAAYPLADAALLGLVVRLLMTPRKSKTLLLVLGGVMAYLASDFAWNWFRRLQEYTPGSWADLGWLACAGLLGVAALHGSTVTDALKEPLSERTRRYPLLLSLVLAGTVYPGLELVLPITDGGSTSILFDSLGLLLGVLVVARLALALRDEALARRELHASRREVHAVVDSAPVGIARTDDHGRILLANEALAKMLGRSQEDLVGLRWSEFSHPEDRDLGHTEFLAVIAGQLSSGQFTKRYVGAGGEALWASVTLSSVLGADGALGAVAIVENVTERRELESQLLQAQRLDAVGELAGGIAHEFNNLLTVIRGYADLLEVHDGLDMEERAAVENIAEASDRAAALTHQLLGFSRRQMRRPELVDLDADVHAIADLLRGLVTPAIRFELEGTCGSARIEIDRLQLQQVLTNLVLNARDAMPDGGTLTISRKVAALDAVAAEAIDGAIAGTYVVLSVGDTGTGMSDTTRARLFEPFFTTKAVGNGTGLGLASVHGILRQSGGFITVATSNWIGSRFDIYLPVAASSTDGVRPVDEVAPWAVEPDSATVLLVEDEPIVRELVRAMLRSDGMTVTAVGHPAEALDLLAYTSFDLLLTDIVMPGMHGDALARQALSLRPLIKVVYMSGHAREGLEGLDDGALFLAKPFTRSEFRRTVHEALEMRPAPVSHARH